jgi:hypothetical protein
VKIDVEGTELRVIQGAEKTLRTLRPVVYTECNAAGEGWPVIQHMSERDYACWLFCFPAYNPANFRSNGENFFGAAREVGLLFLPRERLARELDEIVSGGDLAPVESLDDLVLGMLRKPQYKSEVLAGSVAAQVLGFDFWLNEPEANHLRLELSAAQSSLDALREEQRQLQTSFAEVKGLAEQRGRELESGAAMQAEMQRALEQLQVLAHERFRALGELGERLDRTQAAHEQSQQLAIARAQEIADLHEQVGSIQRALNETQVMAHERARSIGELEQRLSETQAAHEQTQELAHSRARDLELAGRREAERVREIAQLEAGLDEVKAEAARLGEALASATTQAENWRRAHDDVVRSASWRVTAPLRTLARFLRRERREPSGLNRKIHQ